MAFAEESAARGNAALGAGSQYSVPRPVFAATNLTSNPAGFEWVDCKDSQRSVISFLRRGRNAGDQILFVCNFTPVVRENYRVGVPLEGFGKKF
jgi:1,4-alpha-glucan branching enzyme